MPSPSRPIHPDFQSLLAIRPQPLVDLYIELRNFVMKVYPDSNELLYYTQIPSSAYSVSEKLSDAFCHLPIYSGYVNLGFNEGALLDDPDGLLKGSGKLIRHITIKEAADYQNPAVEALLRQAIEMALDDLNGPVKSKGKTISKIKK